MSITKMMSRCVIECTEDAPLEDVYQLIRKCEHGLVIVVDSEAHRVPIGVISERSICEQLIARGKNPRSLNAGSVMDWRIRTLRETDDVSTITADERDTLSAIVVTNERREVCGVIPRKKIDEIPVPAVAPKQSEAAIYVSTNVRFSPAIREIPAFGWIQ